MKNRLFPIPATVISILLYTLLSCMYGCGNGRGGGVGAGETLYSPQYASGFTIHSYGNRGSSILSIYDPWQGSSGVRFDLFISRDGEEAPQGFGGAVVSAPLRSVICMSSSYVAFMDALGEIGAVKGVSGVRYIMNESIRSGYAAGRVRDVGYDSNINYELISSINPDLVLLYGVASENSALTRKLNELKINYLYIGDYVENSPLGKAEWLVAFGEMFDRRAEAETLFASIRDAYLETRDALARYAEDSGASKPVVMLNAPWRDTWFVPGDRSYMVRLIDDAGGEYACRGDDSQRSRPVSVEAAYLYAGKADVWLNPGQASTLAEVKSLNPRFGSIPAVTAGRVYNATLRCTPEGGSDFWESGAVHPDIALKDMAKMLYPGSVPNHKLYYFKKME